MRFNCFLDWLFSCIVVADVIGLTCFYNVILLIFIKKLGIVIVVNLIVVAFAGWGSGRRT